MRYLKTFEGYDYYNKELLSDGFGFGNFFKKNESKIEDESLEFPTGEYCTDDDLPNKGDYVVLNTKYDVQNGFTHSDKFKDKIGVISDKTAIWNKEHTGVLVGVFYENDNKINEDEYAYTQELECWSKNKRVIESYLNSKKYNL